MCRVSLIFVHKIALDFFSFFASLAEDILVQFLLLFSRHRTHGMYIVGMSCRYWNLNFKFRIIALYCSEVKWMDLAWHETMSFWPKILRSVHAHVVMLLSGRVAFSNISWFLHAASLSEVWELLRRCLLCRIVFATITNVKLMLNSNLFLSNLWRILI